jgi:sulfonate transport system permease protein
MALTMRARLSRAQPQATQAFWEKISVWLVPVSILIIWQTLVSTGLVSERILPSPVSVVNAAWDLALSGDLLRDVGVSARRAFTGLLIGGGIGLALGFLNGIFVVSERLLDSSLQMVRTVPHLALLPLVILWFGIGESARVFLIALGVFFPIYLNTFYGIRQVDAHLTEMGRAYGLSTWGLLRHVILPGALPSILVGLRYALGIMWLTLVVAEMNAATSGIGFLTSTAREFMRTDVLTFSIVLYALLGKLADVIARGLERQLLPWHPNYVRDSA